MELSGADVKAEGRSYKESAGSRVLSREQLVRRLSLATSSNNVQAVMRLLADYVGASHFLLARYDLIQEQGLDFIVTSNWPFDLVRRLGSELASGYARSTELEKCLSLLTPSFALLPDDVVPPDDISRQYCSLTFCVGRTRFSLMLLFLEGIILSQERLKEVGLFAAYGASFTEGADARTERDFELTERELECLFWIAEGKTSDEIAVILGISRNTINNYITSVMRKTATKTRSEAIAYAVRNNLV
ncbi:transcriptional regulator VisN [Neorhizobium sp. DT-125]|uniref:transcriptional regulator VisN n=1 Tax=Neorhizobium sp. DT-125 TaxID=3396163 RepID=UPI003F1D9668